MNNETAFYIRLMEEFFNTAGNIVAGLKILEYR